MKRTIAVAAALLALATAACGSDAEEPNAVGDQPAASPAAGACLAGDPDCQDIPGGELPGAPGEPGSQSPTDDGGVVSLPSGGVSIADAVANQIDGGFAIEGFYFDDGNGAVLCEALAESMPPQCGGASIALDTTAGVVRGDFSESRGVTWSDQPVLVVGEIVDGIFVVAPIVE